MLGLTTLLVLTCAPQGPKVVDTMRAYSFHLPVGWRQITPDEHHALRKKMPQDLRGRLIPTLIDRFGDVDRWLAAGFDGRCLTIHRESGEPAMTEETLRQVRQIAATQSTSTPFGYEIERLEFARLGMKNHPVIESQIRITHTDDGDLSRVLEFIIPTGGKTLRFSYRAGTKDFDTALPDFRDSAGTLEITSPPQGRKELSDKLEMPLIIGGVVGLLLLIIYKMRKS